MPRSALLNVIVNAAMKAGRSLTRDFNEVEKLQVSVKGPGDFVSAADRRAEDILHTELSKARPGYGFLMEEGGVIEGSDKTHRWIIDPLDGTTNFLHGIPMFGISVALERGGELVAGVIYNPIMDELFTAEKGSGAFVNDNRIRVSGRRELTSCVLTCGIPHMGRGNYGPFLQELTELQVQVSGVRRTGAASIDLAWVAAGRFDGFWERNLKPWDVAAGMVLVREAGGFTSGFDGKSNVFEKGDIVAGNEYIHQALITALKAAEAKSAKP